MKESVRILIDNIVNLRKEGESDRKIRANLIRLGTSRKLVDESFSGLDRPNISSIQYLIHAIFGKVEVKGHDAKTSGKGPAFTAVFIFFVIGLITMFILFTTPEPCGKDLICFLEKANRCEEVTVHQTIKGVSFSFQADNCKVTKRVDSVFYDNFNLKKLFEGKMMECVYDEGHFDKTLLENLGGNLGKCSGDYKNILLSFGE